MTEAAVGEIDDVAGIVGRIRAAVAIDPSVETREASIGYPPLQSSMAIAVAACVDVIDDRRHAI